MQEQPPERRTSLPVDEACAMLATGSAAARAAARDRLVEWTIEHVRATASRMLRGFPRVRRWDETDDVIQGAALRLSRALDAVTPADGRQLLGLMSLQVRRELIDLARKYASEESFARHHDTNAVAVAGEHVMRSEAAVDQHSPPGDELDAWTRFHDVAGRLDEDERELFNLVWYLGLRQEDAARVLGCSVRTVARRWELTKKHLLAGLGGQEPS